MSDTALIDGEVAVVRAGQTILDAARGLGVSIPTLCQSEGLELEAGCRMCVVEVGEAGKVAAACHTPLQAGMQIRTQSPTLHALRRDVLSLILCTHPPGRFVANLGGNEVERLMSQLDLVEPTFGWRGKQAVVDDSHPYMRFDASKCITCRRCLHACEEVQGQFVYGIAGRGIDTHLIFGPTSRFADSDCTACGACIDRCPTGAITDIDRITHLPVSTTTDSVCGYCGVGCRLHVDTHQNRVTAINGIHDAAVNRGHLCLKGRFAHAFHHHRDRLTHPLLREGESFKPIGSDEALRFAARRLADIRNRHGRGSVAALTSSRSTNEAAYLLQKLFRTALSTNNVDCCARICHSSTAVALQRTTGVATASASYADIERARCIVVTGANPTEAHPIIGARIKEAVLGGATLIVIDPRRIELAEFATMHLQLRAGTNVALFNALAKLLIEEGRFDRAYIEERCEGFNELTKALAQLDLGQVAAMTQIDLAVIRRVAMLIGGMGPTLFVHGLGLSEQTQGVASVETLSNLAMLTGSIGRAGAGVLPLRGQNNVQGNADMGGMPNMVTGYQRIDDPAVRERIERLWRYPLPSQPGWTSQEMLDAAVRGELRALWCQGEDMVQSDPNQSHVIAALRSLELLIVQDPFMCETARYAHLVLPATTWLENHGTFTNAERRIQLVRPAVNPPGESRQDWQVIVDLANAMGQDWTYRSPADVMNEIAGVCPEKFGGVNYARLEGDGLQWPCPSTDHPGSAMLHAEGFEQGRGQLVAIEYAQSPERIDGEYPMLLVTGRVLEHYNVGTMTRRTLNERIVPSDVLEIHPDDAAALAIEEGGRAVVESRWGRAVAPVRHSRRVPKGTVFLSFHFPQTHTNRVIGPHVDPVSKCPDYKVTAVRIRPAPTE